MLKLLAWIFILTLLFFCVLVRYASQYLNPGWSFQVLFRDFKRKIWMTLGLGSTFLAFYLIGVGLSAYFIKQSNTNLIALAYQRPISYIYGGLWLFICLSLSIYLVRMILKYIYLTRGKDN